MVSELERLKVVRDRLLSLVCNACFVLSEILWAWSASDLGVYEDKLEQLQRELCKACKEGG